MNAPRIDPSSIDLSSLNWIAERDPTDPQRPVASSTAVVGGHAANGRVDFFTRWEPNSYCSFHAHLAETGQQHHHGADARKHQDEGGGVGGKKGNIDFHESTCLTPPSS